MSVFPDLERFVQIHRPCGNLTGEAEALTPVGSRVRIVCACGAVIDRWVTPVKAKHDLLCSSVLASRN